MKSIAFTFGRFNPPTIGHEKLIDKTRGANRNYRVYASQSQDPKKNPLNFRNKVAIMKSMFPTHSRKISTDKMTTAIDAMVNLYKEKYTDVLMVVGSDRVAEFDALLKKYNGKRARHGFYKFKSIRVVSAGERIIAIGQPGIEMYAVIDGKLQASIEGKSGRIDLDAHTRGDIVGEAGLFFAKRTA